MSRFETRRAETGHTVIAPHGRLDLVAAGDLRTVVATAVVGAATPLVVDLSDVQFIDSSGLGALVGALRTARQAGLDLRIAGAAEQVLAVLAMTRIDRVLRPYATVQDAVGAG